MKDYVLVLRCKLIHAMDGSIWGSSVAFCNLLSVQRKIHTYTYTHTGSQGERECGKLVTIGGSRCRICRCSLYYNFTFFCRFGIKREISTHARSVVDTGQLRGPFLSNVADEI